MTDANTREEHTGRLLVIDDDQVLLTAMLRLLRGAGYQVKGTTSALEGLELAKLDPPDLVLLDLVMPDMDGMELCRRIRREPRLENTAMVLTSNYRTSPADQAEGFALGIVEFIPRPVENQEFLARIQARMKEKRQDDTWRAKQDGLVSQMTSLRATIEQADLERTEITEELAAIFTHTPVCLLLTDENGKILRANPQFNDILGSSSNVILGSTCGMAFDCVHFQDNQRTEPCQYCQLRQAIAATHTTGQGYQKLPINLISRHGESTISRHFLLTTVPIRVSGFDRVLVCLDDISDKQQMEEDLAHERQRFAQLLETLPFGIFVIGSNNQIEYGNRRLTAMFGPWQGQNCHEYFHDLGQTCPWCNTREVLQGRTLTWEKQIGDDGRHFQIIDMPLANPDGTVAKLVVLRDITEEKRAARKLHQSQEKNLFLSDLLHSSSQPFAVGTADGELLAVNPAFCRLTGYSEEELQKKGFLTLTPSEYHQHEQEILQKIARSSLPQTYEKEYFHRDGHRIPVEVFAHFRKGKEGEPDLFFGFFTNLSERKKYEQEADFLQKQLFQAQKMESVGRLAGGVAHDINNMLSVIMGFGELALADVEPGSALHEQISEMINAGNRSAEITRQLLAFARREEVAPVNIDLNTTIANMLKMLGRLIGENVRLEWHPAEELAQVLLDPAQLDQILANLCVNARDAISGNGTITISTAMVHPRRESLKADSDTSSRMVRLQVSDNGEGIDQEIIDKIFDPFFTTKEVGQGTGLGLATIYGIVKQNHGTIEVESEPGRGTTFSLYFPPTHESVQAPVVQEKVTPSKGNEHVLVVEDEAAILRLIGRILEKGGYRVTLAATAEEALSLTEAVDLVLSDVVMPGMNGRELVERLRQNQPGLRHLFMSGYTDNVLDGHGVAPTQENFVQKPFNNKDLLRAIRRILEEKGQEET